MKTLEYIPDSDDREFTAIEKIRIEVADHADIGEMLDAFNGFLKACGYHPPENSQLGYLDDE